MFKRSIRKDKFFRKQYNSFEIWNLLNKSLKKSLKFYNISEPLLIKKKKYIVKYLYVIIVLKQVEVVELFPFFEFREC
jgi:uncharacterized membrane protein YbaN (DUF454 family)